MTDTIAPVWNGNETWLVLIGASFGSFGLFYIYRLLRAGPSHAEAI
jgi:cytochrome bd-type quinol oxidase subunit 2